MEDSNKSQFTEATLSLLLPTDSKAAITCSGRSHLNNAEENRTNFTSLFCRKTNKKTDDLESGPIADIYWQY